MTPAVEATVPLVGPKVTIRTVAGIGPEGPAADSVKDLVQFSSFPTIMKGNSR